MRQITSLKRLSESQEPNRVLELFSGIGGFREALQQFGLCKGCCFIAVEINDQANQVYRQLCEQKTECHDEYMILNRDITSLPLDFFENSLKRCRIWTMSPPCQPYTVQGAQRDEKDSRAAPLAHLSAILEKLSPALLPDILVLENVPPFRDSLSWHSFSNTLQSRGFHVHTLVVSPHELGWPNKRNRFYAVATLRSDSVPRSDVESFPSDLMKASLHTFIDASLNTSQSPYLLSREILGKSRSLCLDICPLPGSDESACNKAHKPVTTQCFTKAYGRFLNGTGSVLQYAGPCLSGDETSLEHMYGCIRFFSPEEVATLLGFPAKSIEALPMSDRSLYSLLGNSVNCRMIGHILQSLLDTSLRKNDGS